MKSPGRSVKRTMRSCFLARAHQTIAFYCLQIPTGRRRHGPRIGFKSTRQQCVRRRFVGLIPQVFGKYRGNRVEETFANSCGQLLGLHGLGEAMDEGDEGTEARQGEQEAETHRNRRHKTCIFCFAHVTQHHEAIDESPYDKFQVHPD